MRPLFVDGRVESVLVPCEAACVVVEAGGRPFLENSTACTMFNANFLNPGLVFGSGGIPLIDGQF